MCAGGGKGHASRLGDTAQHQGAGWLAWGSVSGGHVGREREGLGRCTGGGAQWNVTKGPEILG